MVLLVSDVALMVTILLALKGVRLSGKVVNVVGLSIEMVWAAWGCFDILFRELTSLA